MDIKRCALQPSKEGSEAYFSGTVRIDAPSGGSGNLTSATVPFEPARVPRGTGTHSARHCSLSLAFAGCSGKADRSRRSARRFRLIRGWREPLERCTPECAMTHIAIAQMRDDKVVDWMDKVTDEQYGGEAQ
jgi:hypothetical protein